MNFQIETPRLLLRDVQEDDIPILVKQFAEPEARGGILSFQADEAYNRNELVKAMGWARCSPRPFYKLAVVLKNGGDLIGSCNLSDAVLGGAAANIGWHYGYRFRNNGYATEAARVLLDFGFEFIKVSEIFADCFADNQASIRIMEKIGMTSHRNFGLFNLVRGWSYGESRPAVRHIISRNQWLSQINFNGDDGHYGDEKN